MWVWFATIENHTRGVRQAGARWRGAAARGTLRATVSDDEVRKLERDSETDPQACVRLARALERAGRPRDALSALVRGASDPVVRREAARYPRDAAPILRAPRVRWETKLDGRDQFGMIEASGLGVVVASQRRTLVLDADTGAHRLELPDGVPGRVGEVVLVHRSNRDVLGHDLWTGEELFTSRLRGPVEPLVVDELLVAAREGEVVGYRFDEPRRAPTVAWKTRLPGISPKIKAVTRDLVVFDELDDDLDLVALDARDGQERFRLDGVDLWLADERGLVVRDRQEAAFLGIAPDGRRAWELDAPALAPFALDAHHVHALYDEWEGPQLVRIDRARGRRSPGAALPSPQLGCLLVGDLLYRRTLGGGLDAVGLDGISLWSWKPSRGPEPRELAAAPGRLYALLGTRSIVCLEET